RSNTPLQALTLLNDAGFVEYAAALAKRGLREEPGDDTARLRHLVRLCLGREPRPAELARLLDLLRQLRSDGEEVEAAWVSGGRVVGSRERWLCPARGIAFSGGGGLAPPPGDRGRGGFTPPPRPGLILRRCPPPPI